MEKPKQLSPWPKYIEKVVEHLRKCFTDRRCALCSDCLALALMLAENLPRVVGRSYLITEGRAAIIIKFITTTLSREYNPCQHSLDSNTVKKLARWVVAQAGKTQRFMLRGALPCHEEFKQEAEILEKSGIL